MEPDRRARVLTVPLDRMADILAGRARVQNLPSDARIVAHHVSLASKQIGFRVHSSTYDPVDFHAQLPTSVAICKKAGD